MILERVGPGHNVPEEFNVIIEIPAHADPVKYEVDKKTGALFVDRFMNTAMHYPCNYGYIPQTLGEDGDPLDVLVVAPLAVISGCVVRCRALGVLHMTDEDGGDPKLLAVPIKTECALYDQIDSVDQMPKSQLNQIAHFFEHYKDLDSGKWVRIDGWGSAEEAKAEILQCVERYNDHQ
ncbi:Inorganic pyrophosphatase [Candidatus Competibacter denitrificans Run_A_D11]|jgi:inorganic pyrophosphatase|uniref:Inorganic pyrophosphatase n=1 Tax=Candidatus Competibacter denitrificans Run_A_D11 TaxID=1400863 RepID=W6MAT6_9GAMM|nr:inorganic diphosphatase [Candidatus Competibacter denitrificans]CDI00908.1 Inorganic pyrophosphatase [Candidatus Competibacter denitrificans Run_A_D11]HAS85448.1 inorganic diphosphatase [Candidatus Competibacteraceae bacterium]HRC70192.1 inorganic diphosphatase [Candidatus Competibacter denitrificans]